MEPFRRIDPSDATRSLDKIGEFVSNAPQETLEKLRAIEIKVDNLAKVLLTAQQYNQWTAENASALSKVS